MTWREILAATWRELATPSPKDEDPYTWVTIQCGHILIGAAWAAAGQLLFGQELHVWIALAGGVLYVLKERGDRIARGGRTSDSLNDLFFVGVGLWFDGSLWWAVIVLVPLGLGYFYRRWRSR